MWCCVDLVRTNVSEESITSIFRVEKSMSLQPPARARSSLRFFYPEYGGDTFLQNVSLHKMYTMPHPRRWHSSSNILENEHIYNVFFLTLLINFQVKYQGKKIL
jgi:hypothetical protein